VKRRWLDEKIAMAAVAAGAELVENARVEQLERRADGWEVLAGNVRYRARALVAADGALSRITELLGIKTPPPDGICSRAYVKAGTHSFDADGVCFYLGEMVPGYAALFREADGDVNFCCYIIPGGRCTLHDLRRMHDTFLNEHPHVRAALGKNAVIDKMQGAPLRLGGRPQTAFEGLLVVGDAAGHIDPLTGEGIHLAIAGGALAAETLSEALAAGDLSRRFLRRYERAVRRAFGWDFWVSTQLARAYTRMPSFIDASALAMQRLGTDALLDWGKVMTGAAPKLAFLQPRFLTPILRAALEQRVKRSAGMGEVRYSVDGREDRWHAPVATRAPATAAAPTATPS
jgi:flavin-dependent dehydrogenase